jgi:Prenyltransferase and squalene oxidase repeat
MMSSCALVVSLLLIGGEPAAVEGNAREAVAKSLVYLEKDAIRWKETYNCATCHHVPMMIWSFREARQAGYEVNTALVDEMTTWMLTDDDARVIPEPDRKNPYFDGLEAATLFVSLAMSSMPEWDDAARRAWKKMAAHVASKQQDDGSFINGMGRPPIFGLSESLAAYAVLILSPPKQELSKLDDYSTTRAKSLAWLAKTPTDGSHQALVFRLLAQLRSTGPSDVTQKLVMALVERQSAEGGWSQTSEMVPDALATGQSLYVLRSAGVPADAESIRRGIAFLLKTQALDGTWPMTSRPVLPGTPTRDKETPKEERPEYLVPITYYGTAWGTLGLIRGAPAK